jgi:cyclic beta-1,2-glucan synthetase
MRNYSNGLQEPALNHDRVARWMQDLHQQLNELCSWALFLAEAGMTNWSRCPAALAGAAGQLTSPEQQNR